MALTLIAVVLSLVLGHIVTALPALRRYDWFVAWLQALSRLFAGQGVWQGRFGLLLAVGVPAGISGDRRTSTPLIQTT